VISRTARLLVAVLLAAVGAGLLVPAAASAAPTGPLPAGQVLVVGVPGLRWDDVDPHRTPHLWALADRGSIGALSVRAAQASTCPGDGWATLGAGNRARGPGHVPGAVGCPPDVPASAVRARTDGSGHYAAQHDLVEQNRALEFDARPGSLADALRCTTTVGAAAAPAGARSGGQLDHYLPALPADPAAELQVCSVGVLAGPTVTSVDRETAVAAADALVGRVDDAREDGSLLLVVGTADPAGPPRLHVALAAGPGYGRGWLGSASTRRTGFVQLIDIAPTVLAAAGGTAPDSVVGRPVQMDTARGDGTAAAIRRLVDADRAAAVQRPLVGPYFLLIVLGGLALFGVAAWSFTRAWRRTGGLRSPRNGPAVQGRVVEVLALAVATAVPASLLAQVVPWWRTPAPAVVLLALVAVVTAAVVAFAVFGPWRRSSIGPIGVVSTFGAVVLAVDVLTGSHLEFGSLPGYSPLVAGRFTGFGNIPFAVFAASVLIAAGCVAQAVRRERRPLLVVVVGVVAVVLVGSPAWGSDVGGLISLAAAVVVATMRVADIRLSVGRLLVAMGVAGLAVVAFAAYDLSRPEAERTHLARFVDQLRDGTASTVIGRKLEANLTLLVNSPLTLLVLGAVLLFGLVLLRPVGGLRRVFALYPGVRAGFAGTTVAAVLGFALNDSGIAVPAFAAAVAVPLAIAVAMRVAAHGRPGETVRRPAAVLYLPPTDPVDAEAVPAADPEPDPGREPVTERTP
jgi:hypothetical protein